MSKCICSTSIYLSIHPSIYIHTYTRRCPHCTDHNNNLLHLYSAFLGTQSALHRRRNLLKHHQCAASTWMMRRQPYCARTPTTHQLTGGEETSDEANLCMGIIRMFSSNIQMQKHPVVLLLETNPSNMYV